MSIEEIKTNNKYKQIIKHLKTNNKDINKHKLENTLKQVTKQINKQFKHITKEVSQEEYTDYILAQYSIKLQEKGYIIDINKFFP
jgi:3-methyladenine DNA glycosylase AlkC